MSLNGQRHAIKYNGSTYYYYYNAQGDVIGLYDANLNSVVQYTYDSWGKVLSVTGSMADTLGLINPFRYRGYYYDTETGLYYLNSRYYDPITGRFINADDTEVFDIDQDSLVENNLFAYCLNNPCNYEDKSGNSALAISYGGYMAIAGAVGGSNFWNPVGWVVIGIAVGITVGTIAYKIYAEHTTLKNGSKKKSNDKHTKPRPGRQNEKKKQKKSWTRRNKR